MICALGLPSDGAHQLDRVEERRGLDGADQGVAVARPVGQAGQGVVDLGVVQQVGHTAIVPAFEPTVVVAGVLVENGRLLLAQRASPPELAGLWELPGGKVEPGEIPEDALVRELREELGIDVTVGEVIGSDVPLHGGLVLRAYAVTRFSGTATALEHDALRWVDGADLHTVDLVPADTAWLPDLAALL